VAFLRAATDEVSNLLERRDGVSDEKRKELEAVPEIEQIKAFAACLNAQAGFLVDERDKTHALSTVFDLGRQSPQSLILHLRAANEGACLCLLSR
jgi:hypothetical protein